MLSARAHDVQTGETVIILALSEENIRRMKIGRPIVLKTSTHPTIPEGVTLFILAGESKSSIEAALAEHGYTIVDGPVGQT